MNLFNFKPHQMDLELTKHTSKDDFSPAVILVNRKEDPGNFNDPFELQDDETDYLRKKFNLETEFAHLVKDQKDLFYHFYAPQPAEYKTHEALRRAGANFHRQIQNQGFTSVALFTVNTGFEDSLAFTEGFALYGYNFSKYKSQDQKPAIKMISFPPDAAVAGELEYLTTGLKANFHARDLVNEPNSYLTARQFSDYLVELGKEAGFQTEVYSKARIESLKMGGLLGVNKGSEEPPTFNLLNWEPENARNQKPYILVGKGVVYDTGGMSLKPTPNSMDKMKSDMAGAAAVAGTVYAIAKARLPIKVIGMIPATDNRPGEKAIVPGDVITMYNGTTVEVMNTDAEGRLILADALSFAKKYDPMLTIDLATLTGSAARTLGAYGSVMITNAGEEEKNALIRAGENVYERVAELPNWDEYYDLLKSDIADLKNIGGKEAGAITAGKFLEYFTAYPWIHLDIAGTAFLTSEDNYRKKNGTGVGVRLLFDFFRNKAYNKT